MDRFITRTLKKQKTEDGTAAPCGGEGGDTQPAAASSSQPSSSAAASGAANPSQSQWWKQAQRPQASAAGRPPSVCISWNANSIRLRIERGEAAGFIAYAKERGAEALLLQVGGGSGEGKLCVCGGGGR